MNYNFQHVLTLMGLGKLWAIEYNKNSYTITYILSGNKKQTVTLTDKQIKEIE